MEADDNDQLHQLGVVVGADFDFDFAFQLQIQETITASLTSMPSSSNDNEVFRVYFKGLVSHVTASNVIMSFAGIGVAIFDANGCVYELGKSFLLEAGGSRTEDDQVELEALIEALNVAFSCGYKRISIFCDSDSVYQYLTTEKQPINNEILTLIDQLNLIQSKFIYYDHCLVKEDDIRFVYTLAREAVVSETTKWAKSDIIVRVTEQCTICFEYVHPDQMLSVDKCLHRYCFSCMRKHVEAKLLQGKLPECPHEKCESSIGIESCKKFLNSEFVDIMRLRVKEASIPPTDKVYCSFSKCSALMSKSEVEEHTHASPLPTFGGTGMRKCVECYRFFCINCKVPWHDNITCSDYMDSFLFQSSNDAKLKSLATKERWRECIKCKNLIELEAGCFHISCRCGYEFCYTCGAEYIYKKPTCSCPLWDERYILYT